MVTYQHADTQAVFFSIYTYKLLTKYAVLLLGHILGSFSPSFDLYTRLNTHVMLYVRVRFV